MSNGNGSTLRAISSPYNFVPLHERVHLPAWGRLVSHDVPFKDGMNAEIHYTLTSESPLLVGGEQAASNDAAPGQVRPFKIEIGEHAGDPGYAIPGSSLKGMLRAVLEIAGFGRMQFVDDRKLSVRDLTGGASLFYRNYMTKTVGGAFEPKVRSGWLNFDGNGTPSIIPCAYSRVEHDDLAAFSGDAVWNNIPREPAPEWKYDRWCNRGNGSSLTIEFDAEPKKAHPHSGKQLKYSKAKSLGAGATRGTLVFTGQPNARKPTKRNPNMRGIKHMEFIFHGEKPSEKLELEEATWKAFLQVHEESNEWKYWKKKSAIPIFYLIENDHVHSFGLAQMYRLPYDHSIGETIDHTSPEHRKPPGLENGYDLADLLFGVAGEGELDSLRGRVSVETALLKNNASEVAQNPTILSSPKPSFYPNYIVQAAQDMVKLSGDSYQTYVTPDEGRYKNRKPRIRGFKRYPARPEADVKVQPLTHDQETGKKTTQVKLFPLEKGARFEGRIICHNLRPVELGALLWVMTWGGREGLRHMLGMGKPFGFGQVRLSIDQARSRVFPNDIGEAAPLLDDKNVSAFRQEFVGHMNKEGARGDWENSSQVMNLLAMADPQAATAFQKNTGASLRHMFMTKTVNQFTTAKGNSREGQEPLVLADYASAVSAGGPKQSRQGGSIDYSGAGFGHSWLDEKIPELQTKHNVRNSNEIIQGKTLATAWSEIDEPELKEAVSKAIYSLWEKHSLHDQSSKAIKKARGIYEW